MRSINDLEHFVLQPGEQLILRCRTHLNQEQLAHMRNAIERAGFKNVLVLPPDIDVMAGQLELMGEDEPPDEDKEAEIRQVQENLQHAYLTSRIVEYREFPWDEWSTAHRVVAPHNFDFGRYEYRLPTRTK